MTAERDLTCTRCIHGRSSHSTLRCWLRMECCKNWRPFSMTWMLVQSSRKELCKTTWSYCHRGSFWSFRCLSLLLSSVDTLSPRSRTCTTSRATWPSQMTASIEWTAMKKLDASWLNSRWTRTECSWSCWRAFCKGSFSKRQMRSIRKLACMCKL